MSLSFAVLLDSANRQPAAVAEYVIAALTAVNALFPALSDGNHVSTLKLPPSVVEALRFAHELLRETCVLELLPIGCCDYLTSWLSTLPTPLTRANSDDVISYFRLRCLMPLCQFLSEVVCRDASASVVPLSTCINLLRHLCKRVSDLKSLYLSRPHPDQPQEPHPSLQYNPVVNSSAYYFTEGGHRLRVTPHYSGLETEGRGSDCRKRLEASATQCSFFFVQCLVHGHCWGLQVYVLSDVSGFHVMEEAEGRRDFFKVSVVKYYFLYMRSYLTTRLCTSI